MTLPKRTLDALEAYRDNREPVPDDFTRAVLNGNVLYFARLDNKDGEFSAALGITDWCLSHLPYDAWGHYERVLTWLDGNIEPAHVPDTPDVKEPF